MSYQTIVVVAATAAAYLHSAVFCDLCPYDPLPTILQPSPRPHSPSFNSKEIVPSRTSKHYSLAAPRRPHPPTPCLLGSNVSSWRLTLTISSHHIIWPWKKKKRGFYFIDPKLRLHRLRPGSICKGDESVFGTPVPQRPVEKAAHCKINNPGKWLTLRLKGVWLGGLLSQRYRSCRLLNNVCPRDYHFQI